ncbi:MAG: aldose epimerase [Blastocatellia bacterium]|nr:aldose epimerase [Blastocatellia bacterium]
MEVVPERGGIISKLLLGGEDIFYLDLSTLEDSSKNVRGGNPILFPICGPLSGGVYEQDGKTFSMKQHGFARNLAWETTGIDLGEESATISVRLESSPVTLEQYPFEFALDFSYILTNSSLEILQRYENRSNSSMPFYAGFHPYFNAPKKDAVSISLKASSYHDFLTDQKRSPESVIDFSATAETNGAFYNVAEPRVVFSNFGLSHSLEINFTAPFKHIVVWGLKDKPFICVEPWMGINNGFNLGESIVYLEPGQELETSVTFQIF